MKVVGITGGMGSGKSYLSHILTTQYGIPVYDCDSQAKRLNEESAEIRRGLTQLVGEDVYDAEGHLQKAVLAAYLFQSEEHQRQVNGIIHPIVRRDFQSWCQSQASHIVGIESAILLESGFADMADILIHVTAPLALRIERAIRRDGSSAEQVEQRIRLQLDDDLRAAQCHCQIINDGRDLTPQIEEMLRFGGPQDTTVPFR